MDLAVSDPEIIVRTIVRTMVKEDDGERRLCWKMMLGTVVGKKVSQDPRPTCSIFLRPTNPTWGGC